MFLGLATGHWTPACVLAPWHGRGAGACMCMCARAHVCPSPSPSVHLPIHVSAGLAYWLPGWLCRCLCARVGVLRVECDPPCYLAYQGTRVHAHPLRHGAAHHQPRSSSRGTHPGARHRPASLASLACLRRWRSAGPTDKSVPVICGQRRLCVCLNPSSSFPTFRPSSPWWLTTSILGSL